MKCNNYSTLKLKKEGFSRLKINGGFITVDSYGNEVLKTIGNINKHISNESQIFDGLKLMRINRNHIVVQLTSFEFENAVYVPLCYESNHDSYPYASGDVLELVTCELPVQLRNALIDAWECIHLAIYEGWEINGLIKWPLDHPNSVQRVHFRWKVIDNYRFPDN